ncbi:hypothetical protein JW968_07185 [Candidatus Woesearchaeota archaeon]|nr:hypothetical protein [Candidatus Woesearchaeota archaeon]
MKYIRWFRDLGKSDIPTVGGKGANLGEMFNVGLPIPDGFCVTAQAYEEFIQKNNLAPEMTSILSSLDVEDTEKLQQASAKIEKLILSKQIPDDMKDDIIRSYRNLGGFVAVRSSATAEDLPTASFAGQQATFLNIKGNEEVIKAVRECWASLFTARAIYYRDKNNFDHMKVLISVVIQKMVNSDKAGVMFSVNPVTNDDREIIIEGSYGLGEAVVSGSVNPDSYIINKSSGKVTSENIASKTWGYFKDQNGATIKKDIPEFDQEKRLLSDSELKQLLDYALLVEKHYDFPQDMEWAIEGDKVFLTQARPVTTFKPKKDQPKIDNPQKKPRLDL